MRIVYGIAFVLLLFFAARFSKILGKIIAVLFTILAGVIVHKFTKGMSTTTNIIAIIIGVILAGFANYTAFVNTDSVEETNTALEE
jgi:hypothetical protein